MSGPDEYLGAAFIKVINFLEKKASRLSMDLPQCGCDKLRRSRGIMLFLKVDRK